MPLDANFGEQFPLSPFDDHMIHQTADPLRYVWTSDVQAYERHWMACHDDSGEVSIVIGGSFYPNLDSAEAFAIVNLAGTHVAVRGFRRVGADRSDLHIGPIKPTIVEGMRHWHFQLDENEWGSQLDIHAYDITRQVMREPLVRHSPHFPGRQAQITAGFESFVELEGTVTVGDRTVELTRDTFRGSRDRHWGTGRGVGGPAMQFGRGVPGGGHSGNCFVMFDDYGIWGDRLFYRFGDERPGAGTVTTLRRRLRFEPDTKIFIEGEVDYRLSGGKEVTLRFERIANQTVYLRCGMYGGTPDGLRYQGVYPGEDLVEGSVHDASLPEHRADLAGLDEHTCTVTRDDGATVVGVFQPIDPQAYEWCASGRRGWELL